jgi:putative membrane protein
VTVAREGPVVSKADRGFDPAVLQLELALLRTRLAVERTLLAVVRSALGLITFGIVLFEFVEFLLSRPEQATWIPHGVARDVGIGITGLAIAMLVAGLVSGRHMSRRLHVQWNDLRDRGLVAESDRMPTSFVPAVAFLLLLVGIMVIVRMIWRAGYFA